MSLITSCPACSTVFHVKPEQLSLRRGTVRCGECQHVFNALDHLHEADSAVPDSAVPDSAVPEAEPHAAVEMHAPPKTPPHTPSQPVWRDAAPKSKLQTVTIQRRTFPWLSGFFILLLLIAIILQLAYFQRNALALAWPDSKPYLQQVCVTLKCTVELPKDASKLVIDDANLLEDSEYEGLLVLTSTLINQAKHVQAYPQLELTLTDANDQAVLRRTFNPEEYLPAGTAVEKGIAAGKELPIKLLLTADHQTVSGYRLFVNY